MECQLNAKSTLELRPATCDLISPKHGEQISEQDLCQRVSPGEDVFFVIKYLLANISPLTTCYSVFLTLIIFTRNNMMSFPFLPILIKIY